MKNKVVPTLFAAMIAIIINSCSVNRANEKYGTLTMTINFGLEGRCEYYFDYKTKMMEVTSYNNHGIILSKKKYEITKIKPFIDARESLIEINKEKFEFDYVDDSISFLISYETEGTLDYIFITNIPPVENPEALKRMNRRIYYLYNYVRNYCK